jgi:hypothetical protein
MIIKEEEIRELASHYGWREQRAKDPTLLIFNRYRDGGHQQVNIWYTQMTVGTSLKHPKYGKTQLFRRHVDRETLKQILANPRTHTRKGYYTR